MSREPFWPMPRWLSRAVDRGELSPFQFTLVCYLGGRGLEHHGVDVTLGELASTFSKTEKWVSRSLRSLRDEAHLIEYELRQGQKSKFHVTAGQALRSGVSALYFKPTTSELTSEVAPPSGPTSEVTSEVTSVSQFRGDLGSRGGGEAAQAESVSGFAECPTSEVGRGDKNENENRRPLAPTERLRPEVDHRDVGADVDDGGATDRLIELVRGSATSNGRLAVAVGEVVECRRHGPRPVTHIAAGLAWLGCGCLAIEEPARA